MNKSVKKYFKIWMLGFLVAIIFIWLIGIYFASSPPDWQKCEELGIYVRKQGTVVRTTSEGWGRSEYGKYDIIGIEDIDTYDTPKVIIWGDSFVVGFMVPDDKKLPQQFTKICRYNNDLDLLGVGVAGSGRSVPDYYDLMPRYESVVKPLLHVIVIAGFSDISPDNKKFVNNPHFSLTPYNDLKKRVKERRLLNKLKLNFIYKKVEQLMVEGLNLNFGLGEVKINVEEGLPIEKEDIPTEAWDFLLSKVRERTDVPLLFVYTPPVPTILKGELDFQDKYSVNGESIIFNELCKKHNIGYIDMKDRNIEYFHHTGRFPRGFHNGGFTSGHCNEYGLRLMAEAISDYVAENIDGIYTD